MPHENPHASTSSSAQVLAAQESDLETALSTTVALPVNAVSSPVPLRILTFEKRDTQYSMFLHPIPPSSELSTSSGSEWLPRGVPDSWACCRCDAGLYSIRDESACMCGHSQCSFCDAYLPSGVMDLSALNSTFSNYSVHPKLELGMDGLPNAPDGEAGLHDGTALFLSKCLIC